MPEWKFEERVLQQLGDQTRLLEELVEQGKRSIRLQLESLRVLKLIAQEDKPYYSVVVVQETEMADGVTVGVQGVFNAVLNENGSPIALPTGSSWAWSASDPAASITQDPSDSTGGTVDVVLPAGDTTTSLTMTALTTDATGTPVSGSLTVPVTPGTVNTFSVTVTQIAGGPAVTAVKK